MDNSTRTNSGGLDEIPRAKFLCSFGGCVLPRPQDGKLRYVGGETRIVTVPCNIGYEELLGRMREIYEEASILKYQQPDEDLDALVSVVNDDDVTNMLEEYDKLGSADAFTKLRIFLFSHFDQDSSPRYMEADERNGDRRYVDALNSLNDSPEYRRQNLGDSSITAPVDEIHIVDQFFNSMSLDGSVHNQRNYEMGMPQSNSKQLASASMVAGQQSLAVGQLHNEEVSCSPAGYSPRYAGPNEMHTYTEVGSPSYAHFHMAYQEIADRCMDRVGEESNLQQVNSQLPLDRRQQYSDQVVWLPTGAVPVDIGGFPGNTVSGHNVVDCPSVCQHCKTTFRRTPSSSDFLRKPEEQGHVEQLTMGNGLSRVASTCVECLPRAPISGVGRMGDQCTVDGPSTKFSVGPGNLLDGYFVPTTCTLHRDPGHIRAGAELGGEIFHGQAMPNASHVQIPLEERGLRAANLPYTQGAGILPQLSHSNTSVWAKGKNAPAPLQVLPHDPPILHPRSSIPSGAAPIPRDVVEGSPRCFIGVDQGPWVEFPQRRVGVDGSTVPEYPHGNLSMLNPPTPFQKIHQTFSQDPLRNTPNVLRIPPSVEDPRSSELPSLVVLNDNLLSSDAGGYVQLRRLDSYNIKVGLDERSAHCGEGESTSSREAKSLDIDDVHPPKQNCQAEQCSTKPSLNADKSNSLNPGEGSKDSILKGETKTSSLAKNGELHSLPEQIASTEGAKLKGAEEFKGDAQENNGAVILRNASREITNAFETESVDVKNDSEGGSENECAEPSKIEPTKAEEEAIAKGLQTIKNADLEEVRELGSGTYGAVYHGKWRGSDVAIKRIKASCFAGRPSERERLIADFWKEALILSSLHHPNVVSFYGIVRDGPDGSLATVTEYMVNGSLKQFIQKKDRTIDRRKRLIIAMDAAFGMEYLHEKGIVHFDLKCDNLLVNMRDPHRPVCKVYCFVHIQILCAAI
ncbi:hypothetical protein Cgig2_033798 [Carnegiea gigantea]|uniref:Protein kinase domain-containing protein n=1 Tax=Carnegiea gigantea TaxID=171969 RepID=A0A9Q1GSF8_9CARY|nr:hypothetical protein Cgig2_033798 [Carnegiea gigantea]